MKVIKGKEESKKKDERKGLRKTTKELRSIPSAPKVKKYTQDAVYKALDSIDNGMTTRRAEQIYNIPRSTLYAKQNFIIPVEASMGRSPYLSDEEEQKIVDWVFQCSDRGFPITKCVLLKCVQKLIIKLKRNVPFKDGKPGESWWKLFRKRHDKVALRVAQNLTIGRVSATEEVIRNWFKQVKTYLNNHSLLDIDKSRIFNLDESAFLLSPKGDKVLARRGSKTVYKIVNGEKESITVLFNVSGAGVMLPPMLLFWYERTPALITKSLPSGWLLGNTEKGWMTSDKFFDYITNKFYPWLKTNHIEFPVILFVDGHSSHLSLPLSVFCNEKQIVLIALYPNATHILQPLDVAVFRPMKSAWKNTIDDYRLRTNNPGIRREHFAPLLKQAIDGMGNLPKIIENGFTTCGLTPLNPDAIDYGLTKNPKKKFISLKQQEQQQQQQEERAREETSEQLHFFEKNLDQETLTEFQMVFSNSSLKITNSENEGLYQYWKKLKSSGEIEISATTEECEVNKSEDVGKVDSSEVVIEVIDSSIFEPTSDSYSFPITESEFSSYCENGLTLELMESSCADIYCDKEVDCLTPVAIIKKPVINVTLQNLPIIDEPTIDVPVAHQLICNQNALDLTIIKKNVLSDITNNNVAKCKEFYQSTIELDFDGVMKETFYYPPDMTKPQKKGKAKLTPILSSEEFKAQKIRVIEEKEDAQKATQERKRVTEEKKMKRILIDEKIKQLQNEKKNLTAKRVKKENIDNL